MVVDAMGAGALFKARTESDKRPLTFRPIRWHGESCQIGGSSFTAESLTRRRANERTTPLTASYDVTRARARRYQWPSRSKGRRGNSFFNPAE
jgi:hypothetical protein